MASDIQSRYPAEPSGEIDGPRLPPRAAKVDEGDITGATLDHLLSKYVSVWLWSIVFGSISALAFSLTSYHGSSSFYALAALVPLAIGMLAVSFAFLNLYRGLVRYLLPRFLLNQEGDSEYFAYSLQRAVAFLIVSLVVRLFLAGFDTIVSALR
jgi:hypothetical protein